MINVSKKNIAEIGKNTNFIKDNIEKVLRLVDILDYVYASPIKDKLVLKGGTAINLTYFNMPRLSVDIDMDYIILDRNTMLEDKVKIKEFFTKAMYQKGYAMSPVSKSYHALDSFVFNYTNNGGNKDNIKIEINYMDRVHIMDFDSIIINNAVVKGESSISVVDRHELFGSKIAALISRCKPRDLYDVYGLITSNIEMDKILLKKCAIFYNCVGGSGDLLSNNFAILDGITGQSIVRMLKPVISKQDKFDYKKAVVEVKKYLKEIFVLSDEEKQFIIGFNERQYKPLLLFDEYIAIKVANHPMALWKMRDESKNSISDI